MNIDKKLRKIFGSFSKTSRRAELEGDPGGFQTMIVICREKFP